MRKHTIKTIEERKSTNATHVNPWTALPRLRIHVSPISRCHFKTKHARFTRLGNFFSAQPDMVKIQQKVLSRNHIKPTWESKGRSTSYLKHRYSPPQKHAIRLTSSRQRLHAPQRTQTKCTFFSSHTIFCLFSVITIHEILKSSTINFPVAFFEDKQNARSMSIHPWQASSKSASTSKQISDRTHAWRTPRA